MRGRPPADYTVEIGPMGPIGEGEALVLRINRHCPWNRCLFCPVYKGRIFGARALADILRDLEAVARVWALLDRTSWEIGLSGRIRTEAVRAVVNQEPELYGAAGGPLTPDQQAARETLLNVANWMQHGARRVFLQDADALRLPTEDLAVVLRRMKALFPSVDRVSSYARARTCARRAAGEWAELKAAGLSAVFVGFESGADTVLEAMRKGACRADHLAAGAKITAAGVHLAAFVMPGLAGSDPAGAEEHVASTVSLLNAIRPNEVRVRSLAVVQGTPLYRMVQTGAFRPADEDQLVRELGWLVEGLAFDCLFETLQLTNPLFNVRVPLEARRDAMRAAVAGYLSAGPLERARFLFDRIVRGGYWDWLSTWGADDPHLAAGVAAAERALAEGSDRALAMVQELVWAIKTQGIP